MNFNCNIIFERNIPFFRTKIVNIQELFSFLSIGEELSFTYYKFLMNFNCNIVFERNILFFGTKIINIQELFLFFSFNWRKAFFHLLKIEF